MPCKKSLQLDTGGNFQSYTLLNTKFVFKNKYEEKEPFFSSLLYFHHGQYIVNNNTSIPFGMMYKLTVLS